MALQENFKLGLIAPLTGAVMPAGTFAPGQCERLLDTVRLLEHEQLPVAVWRDVPPPVARYMYVSASAGQASAARHLPQIADTDDLRDLRAMLRKYLSTYDDGTERTPDTVPA